MVPLLGGFYLTLSGLFALVYAIVPEGVAGAHPGRFLDYFFFSVQTLATIGYGAMYPVGDFANTVVSIEAFCGVLSFALMSGLMFAKFSVPTARVGFANFPVVARRDGKPALMFRMANTRGNQILEAHVNLSLNRIEPIDGDPQYRRFHKLPLLVSDSPLFVLSFTATHIIDESSPLFGVTAQEMQEGSYQFVITLIGLDGLVSQTVHARYTYAAHEIKWNHKFSNTLSTLEDGTFVLDYSKFHDVEPFEVAEPETPIHKG